MTDVVIVGAGSAGCVLANRLSAAGAEVHVVEAGPDTPPGRVPADINDLYPRSYFNDRYLWRLDADQGGDGSGAKTPFLQGRVVGGGSSVMGMIALRGVPDDYDGWEAHGASGWGWQSVLPYFRRLETDRDCGGELHGDDGPVTVRRHHPGDWPPFCRAVGEAAEARGWPFIEDANGDFRDGHFSLPLSATLSGRVSAAGAYLDQKTRARKNLTIESDATVEHLLFDRGRCVGVSVISGGRRRKLLAARTILAAGAIHSPAVLMRSGVGPADHLSGLGIPVVADLSGVGGNLQNHPVVYLATHLRRPGRQSPMLRPQFNSGVRYTSALAGTDHGDMMLLVLNRSSWHGLGAAVAGIGVCLFAPRSRGTVRLLAADPATSPDIRFGMLTEASDFERMVEGMRTALELIEAEGVRQLHNEVFAAGYSRVVRELNKPGMANRVATRLLAALLDGPRWLRHTMIKYGIAEGDVDVERMRDRSWLQATVRRRSFGTYHPAGTCRMGPESDPLAVVGPACHVHGVEGLSVVDASVMPTLVRANTNLPTIMVAERAAALMAEAANH